MGDNGKLVQVVPSDNNLGGQLPKSLGNCNNLIFLNVQNDKFFENIPSGLWTLMNMGSLLLSNNSFTGELHERLSHNLSRLEIGHNRFLGKILTEISSWKNLVFLDVSNNILNGSISQERTALPRLTTLLLDHNRLLGSLPSNIIS